MQIPSFSAKKKHTDIVTQEKIIVSTTLKTTDFLNFFLIVAIFLFTYINNAPRRPPIIPNTMGPCTYLK